MNEIRYRVSVIGYDLLNPHLKNGRIEESEMIKSIYVDGLRSLREFNLVLKPGLNVLVGPNGSGKSNILATLELVSAIINNSVRDFKHNVRSMDMRNLFDVRKKDRTIHIILTGELNQIESEIRKIEYKYEFKLEYKPNQIEKIFFSKQSIEIEVLLPSPNETTQKLKISYDEGRTSVIQLDDIFTLNDYTKEIIEKFLNDIENNINMSFKYNSLIGTVNSMTNLSFKVMEDLILNIVYTIEPNLIRFKIEDPTPPFLGSGGFGLLPTLQEIIDKKDDQEVDEDQKAYPGYNYQDIYNKIICYFKQLCPEIKELKVEFNDYKNKFEAEVLFENGDGIPLEQMSDGTIKWLYLITALLLSPGIFLLEEPENFLHPKMQQQFIDLTRSVLDFRSGMGLVSTHSETILNKLDAKEMIVSYFENDRTHANRIKNLSRLEDTLRETGFKLGQYYALGTLDYKSQE